MFELAAVATVYNANMCMYKYIYWKLLLIHSKTQSFDFGILLQLQSRRCSRLFYRRAKIFIYSKKRAMLLVAL
jgi:hypothetical protein